MQFFFYVLVSMCTFHLFGISKFYGIHFHAYDQYSKTEPTYAQYYCLFI
jgi:hypothetical protein